MTSSASSRLDMILLALTTSTDHGSVALWRDGKTTLTVKWKRTSRGGSETIHLKIKALLKKAKLKPADLNALAVDKGPGSFTGCRIAVNLAKTFAYTLGIPVIAVYSLDVLAQMAATKIKDGRILCVLDAHKSLLYSAFYDAVEGQIISLGKPEALSSADLMGRLENATIVAGSMPVSDEKVLHAAGAKILKNSTFKFPQAKVLAQLARERLNSESGSWHEVEPTYIRAPDAVEKLRL